MEPIFYESSLDHPVGMDIAPTPIRVAPAPATARPRATSLVAAGYFRPRAGGELNSRLDQPLPAGKWSLQWRTDLDADSAAVHVLWAADRIIVQGTRLWELFDRNGKRIINAGIGPGDMAIDPAGKLFYTPDSSGTVSARKLADGSVDWRVLPLMPRGYRRDIFPLGQHRVCIRSFELAAMSSAGLRKPDLTTIELIEPGEAPQADGQRMLPATGRGTSLLSRATPLECAVGTEGPVMAVPDHLFLADARLHITRNLQEQFEPAALSLDESGTIYMIVRGKDGMALWVVDRDGTRPVAHPLGAPRSAVPAVIGSDHCVYVRGQDRLIALEANGTVRWENAMAEGPGGMTATRDDHLLASSGHDVLTFDATGHRDVLYHCDADALLTPPVLTDKGELLVASKSRLYCLVAQRP